MIQLIRIQLKLRLTLKHNVVLIHLRIHGADLSLTKSIVESVIDGGGRDPKPRGCDSVNHQRYGQSSRLLIGSDILQFRQLF
jgi:hypothetical protein